MSFKNSIKPITRTSLDTAGLGLPYQVINVNGLPFTCCRVRIANQSTIPVTISWDGAVAHDWIPAGGVLDLQFFNTGAPGINTPQIQKGQRFYASSAVGAGVGYVFVHGYYQESN